MTYDIFKFSGLHRALGIPLITYKGERDNLKDLNISTHIRELYGARPELKSGEYHIVYIWTLKDYVMTDVWVFRQNTWNENLGQNLGAIYVYSGKSKIDYAELGSDRTVLTSGKAMQLMQE